MAKVARERAVRERRERKQEKKRERRLAAAERREAGPEAEADLETGETAAEDGSDPTPAEGAGHDASLEE
jgi:hypothetical protein